MLIAVIQEAHSIALETAAYIATQLKRAAGQPFESTEIEEMFKLCALCLDLAKMLSHHAYQYSPAAPIQRQSSQPQPSSTVTATTTPIAKHTQTQPLPSPNAQLNATQPPRGQVPPAPTSAPRQPAVASGDDRSPMKIAIAENAADYENFLARTSKMTDPAAISQLVR